VRLSLICALGVLIPLQVRAEPSPEDVRSAPPWASPASDERRVPEAPSAPTSELRVAEAPSPSRTTATGALRAGLYADGDQTIVFRALGALSLAFKNWNLNAGLSADVVSSASVDVRSSPLGKVDVVSTASGTSTRGGKMSDRRLAATLGAGWRDGDGHGVSFSASYANENDYNSVSGNVNSSIDVWHRMTTLLGGFTFTQNWIGSMLDSNFARTMYEIGWSAGIAQVLGFRDAVRLRYDGAYSNGYQASPYRNVRFGDWTITAGPNQQILFANTIGSADGLPEKEPGTRTRHALVLEWLHSLSEKLALHSQARLGIDDWGALSGSAALDLRGAWQWWRLQLGYRFYAQSSADFYQSKYTAAPATYSYYTSDKELGRELGHMAHVDLSRVIKQPRYPGDTRVLFDARLTGLFYSYPGFVLLDSRSSVFLDLGFTWE
jgi:hypothetical protein